MEAGTVPQLALHDSPGKEVALAKQSGAGWGPKLSSRGLGVQAGFRGRVRFPGVPGDTGTEEGAPPSVCHEPRSPLTGCAWRPLWKMQCAVSVCVFVHMGEHLS